MIIGWSITKYAFFTWITYSKMAATAVQSLTQNHIDEIYFYENTEPFRGKLGWNVSWIILVTMRSPSRTLKLNIRT